MHPEPCPVRRTAAALTATQLVPIDRVHHDPLPRLSIAMTPDDPNRFPSPDPSEPTDSALMRDILARTRDVSRRIVERVQQVCAEEYDADGRPVPPGQPD